MMDMITRFLSYVLMFLLSCGAVCGVVLFFLAATWMQVHEVKESGHEQKA